MSGGCSSTGWPCPNARYASSVRNRHKQLTAHLQQWNEQYGMYYGILEGWQKKLIISDPQLIQQVFITQFECFKVRSDASEQNKSNAIFQLSHQQWKEKRNEALTAFRTASFKQIWFPLLIQSVEQTIQECDEQKIENLATCLERIDWQFNARLAYYHVMHCSQKIVLDFSTDFADTQKIAKYANMAGAIFRHAMEVETQKCRGLVPNFSYLLRICCPPQIVATLHSLLDQFSSFFVPSSSFKNPFLALCEQIALQELGLEAAKAQSCWKPTGKLHLNLCELLLLDYTLSQSFLSVRNELPKVLRIIATNKAIKEKLFTEIKHICGNEALQYEHLSQMAFADALIKESLRLDFTITLETNGFERKCVRSTTLHTTDQKEIHIEQGTLIRADIRALHTNPAIWGPNASEFRPERWLPQTADSCSTNNIDIGDNRSFLSFGIGPRKCPADRVSQMHLKVLLVLLSRQGLYVASATAGKNY